MLRTDANLSFRKSIVKLIAIAALLGAATQVEATQTSVTTLKSLQSTEVAAVDSDDEGIMDLVQLDAPCVYLDETAEELAYQVEMFSRTLDIRHWTNAKAIQDRLISNGQDAKIKVFTWELYDKAFSFPRVRRYEFVQENMDMLEHF